MALRLFSDAAAFADALAATSGHLYSICNRDRLDPGEVLRLELSAAEHRHGELLGAATLREDALREIETFFREAARLDPQWRFAYSSKVVLSVPDWQDLQKVFLLRAHFAASAEADVLLLVPDARLRRLFAELFADAPPSHGVTVPSTRAWVRFARTFLRAVVNRAPRVGARVLVFTLSSGVPRAANDPYFGNLAESMGRDTSTLTVYLASGAALRLPRDAARIPLEAFVPGVDVMRAWLAAFVSGLGAASTGESALAPLHRYLRTTEIRSGEYFMHRLFDRAFRRMLARVSPAVLVYPFENRTWEKHLLAAARERGVGQCVAYQHSSITPRHLAFHIEEGEIGAEHLPDRVVTIGEHTSGVLRKLAPALTGVLATGASLRTARQAVADSPGPGVLVAISSSRNEALSLLQATFAAASRVALPFIVRTHPTIPVDALFALFPWPANVELSSGRSLADDLSRVTMVAYSSSTVALEGMLYGRLPIFVDIGDLPSGDPIIGDYAFKRSAAHGSALGDAADHLCRLDPAQLHSLQAEARTFAENYLRAPSAEEVERMSALVLAS